MITSKLNRFIYIAYYKDFMLVGKNMNYSFIIFIYIYLYTLLYLILYVFYYELK